MKTALFILTLLTSLLGCSEEPQENDIYGTWKLVSFVNEKTEETFFQGDFQNSNQITIEFKANMSFSGSTTRNTFQGEYSFGNNRAKLIYTNFGTTKVNESDWGNLFYNKLGTSYNQQTKHWENTYSIIENSLRIDYAEHEYMLFEK